MRLLAAAGLACAWLVLAWRTMGRVRAAHARPAAGGSHTLVVYASQTGTAKEIAQRTVQALGAERAVLLSMAQLRPEQLLDYRRALFVVSTYGEGDPPDMAHAFYRQALARAQDAPYLGQLQGAVLALGDSGYRHYCGFGRALGNWLEQQGATLLFEPVLADKCDPGALLSWSDHLSRHFQVHRAAENHYADWRLAQRRHLNPGSSGGACYELCFESPAQTGATWCAGDIAEIAIGPHGMHRDYSIASTAGEGVLCLLVRRHCDANGNPGTGSRWLTEELEEGATVRLRIRENSLFHAPEDARPAIFIGNGTGIAGLRSLLRHRLEQGHYENWLIFGERQRASDFHYGEQLSAWQSQKRLARLDLAFSRDQASKHYVHHVLRDAAAEVREWVARGAVIYVCGSKNGMAADVDRALQEILGRYGYAALCERQDYRRDVY